MSNKSVKKNYIYNLSYEILLLIIPLITTPYLAAVLKAKGLGTVSYVESIVTFFMMFAILGTGKLGQREISYVQDDKQKRSNIFWNLLTMRSITSLLCASVYLVSIFILCRNKASFIIYTLYIVNIIGIMFDVSWFFQGLEEFGKIVFRNFIFKILNVVYIFVFVKTIDDIAVYVGGLVFLQLASNLSMWVFLPKMIVKPHKGFFKMKPYLRGAIALFIPTIAIQVYTVLDKTMIGLFSSGSDQNGYYEMATRISRISLTIVTALGAVVAPRIGYYLGKKKYVEVKNYMYRSYRFVWLLGIPLCFGLIGIADNITPWFFHTDNNELKILIKILSIIIVAVGLSNVTGIQYLIPKREQRLFTKTILIGASCNFALNLVLIPLFYALGAAIASVVAEIIITTAQLYYVRKEFSIKHIFKTSRLYLIAGLIMFILLSIESHFLKPSLINTCIMISTGALIYLLILIIRKDEYLIEEARVITDRLKRK